MYESDYRLGLDPETLERMRGVFGGHTCCRCGGPAERLSAGQFYCGYHAPARRKETAPPPRVYRCTVALSD